MMRASALVLVLALVWVARQAGEGSGRFAIMALGFVLIVAALAGEAGERFRLPRLTGYLLVGVCFGPEVMDLITPGMAGQLRLINGVAVALIGFSAGMEIDLPALRSKWRSVASHGGIIIGLLFSGLFLLTLAAFPLLPLETGHDWNTRIAVALMVAAVMATFSPAVTISILAETRARGPLAERVLALVVLGDLVILVLFTFCSALAGKLTGATMAGQVVAEGWIAEVTQLLGHVTWEVIGSPVVGALAGLGIYLYRRFVDRRSGLVVAAACLVLAEFGTRAGLSPLLACIAAGLTVRNADPDAAHAMDQLIARVRLPILVVFFAAAGASLHLGHLLHLWPAVLGLVAARTVLVRLGNRAGAARAHLPEQVVAHVPNGLLSQAGVTLGLAVIVGRDFAGWGPQLETLFVAVISVHELIGPVLFRWSLAQLGEIPPKGVESPELTPAPLPARG